MITFDDGPAKGIRLELRRTPVMLRVVCDDSANWDALDQLEDVPRDNETIYIYRLSSSPRRMHLCGTAGCRIATDATYCIYLFSIDDEHCRTNEGWSRWCEENRERLLKEFGVAQEP